MDRESVLAKCHLHAVLPLLEEITEYDEEARGIVAGWDGTIQLSCTGGLGEYIEFTNGRARSHRGRTKSPTIALWFWSPAQLNKMFTGKGLAVPVPWKGLTKIGMLKGFTALTKRLEYYLKTPEDQLPERHKRFVVTLKMYTAVRALKEIGENDPDLVEVTSHLPNGVAELRVLPDGPVAHVKVLNGVITPDKGAADLPNAIMEFADLAVASALFDDKLDAMAALGTGDVRIRGMIPMIDSLNAILDRIPSYLA